jgi:beta-lactamase superfamily II metal-dependent hydrolase
MAPKITNIVATLVRASILSIVFACCMHANAYLEIMVRNVGQANCVAIKNGNKAILIDCGVHQSGSYRTLLSSSPRTDPVLGFLQNCELTVFITHTHYDHFSLLLFIIKNVSPRNIALRSIFCSDFSCTDSYKALITSLQQMYGIPITSVNKDTDLSGVKDILGGGVTIEPVIPSEWPQHGKKVRRRSTDPNDNSLVLVVKDAIEDKKFLFPGDATGLSLEYIRRDSGNIEKLKDIDCIIVPHHGSNLSGAFDWVHFVEKNVSASSFPSSSSSLPSSPSSSSTSTMIPPLLAVVSSDPKECDSLPWFGVRDFFCFRSPPNSLGDVVEEHDISVATGTIEKYKKPVFVTKNAKAGYFLIQSFKRAIHLFNGTNLEFLSNKEVVEPSPDVGILLDLSQNKLNDAYKKITNNYKADTLPDVILIEIFNHKKFEQIAIESLKAKLSSSTSLPVDLFMIAAKYSLDSVLQQAVINFIKGSQASDENLMDLLQYPHLYSTVSEVIKEKYKGDLPLNVAFRIAHYVGFSDLINNTLNNHAEEISDEKLFELAHYDHLKERIKLILGEKLTKGVISPQVIELAITLGKGVEVSAAFKKHIDDAPHDSLSTASRYSDLNVMVFEILNKRIYLTEEEWLDYMLQTKKYGNSELLTKIAGLQVIKE